MKTITQQYAQFIASLSYEDLPKQAVAATKTCLLDGLGNLIYGRYAEMGARALKTCAAYPVQVGMELPVKIPGGDFCSSTDAAFACAVMARCADLDDGHRFAMGHPGSVLVPAVLVYGQQLGSNGQDILTALAAGYEVYTRLGAAINPSSYRERGFDSTGVTGAVACTAALGKLFHLSEMELTNALGLAPQFTGGLIEYQNDGSMAKVLCGAWAISTALRSIRLARCGFTGAAQALEGKKGFIQAFSNAPAPEKALASLGEEWKITEIYFKLHACMRGLHAAVDAMLDLRAREGLAPENTAEIQVHTTSFVARLSKPYPATEIAAQSSIEFALAVALTYGHIAGENALKEAMGRPEIYRLAGKVKLILDDEVDAYVKEHPSHWGAVRLRVHTTDGHWCEQWNPLPRGEAERPFTWQQLCEKFARLASGTPYEPCCGALCAELEQFETVSSVGDLFTPWEA